MNFKTVHQLEKSGLVRFHALFFDELDQLYFERTVIALVSLNQRHQNN